MNVFLKSCNVFRFPYRQDLHRYVAIINAAVGQLRSTSWAVIKQDKFATASDLLYDQMVQRARPYRERQELKADRRAGRLRQLGEDSDDEDTQSEEESQEEETQDPHDLLGGCVSI